MSTSISNATSFCTPTQALDSYDARAWGDCFLDTGARETGSALLTDPRFQNLLNEAAGLIEMACLKGGIYQPADLSANLTGVSLQMLVGLNAKLAFWLGKSRRNPDAPLPPTCIWALQTLEKLESGDKIFSFAENVNAGLPETAVLSGNDYDTLTLASDVARRYFGGRSKWIAANGGLAGGGGGYCGGCD
jgi:hypothetical protein